MACQLNPGQELERGKKAAKIGNLKISKSCGNEK